MKQSQRLWAAAASHCGKNGMNLCTFQTGRTSTFFSSYTTKDRTKGFNHEVGGQGGRGEGGSHSLICLQIQPSCGGGPPPPPEPNNPNVQLHTHVIINELCLHPF